MFKWFLDIAIDDRAFDATTFIKNRQRLLDHETADRFFAAVVAQAKLRRYMSSDHFSVEGTLLQAWASNKSFKPNDRSDDDGDGNGFKGRNAEVDFKGQKRSNKTHTSTTDPEAMLFRRSNNTAAELSYMGHLLIENRSALIVDADLTQATGFAERDCATDILARLPAARRRRTVAADKNYDTKDFVADVRGMGFTPHVAENTINRRSAIDGRTTRRAGHTVSQRIRKRVEEPFGWIKTVGAGRKLSYIGQPATGPGSRWRPRSTTSSGSAPSMPPWHDRALLGRRSPVKSAGPKATGTGQQNQLVRLARAEPLPRLRFSAPCQDGLPQTADYRVLDGPSGESGERSGAAPKDLRTRGGGPGRRGSPDRHMTARAIRRLCVLAEVPPVTPNELRHTAITHQADEGWSSFEIADWAGTSEQMISTRYRRLWRVSRLRPGHPR